METTRDIPFAMSDQHSHPRGIRFTVFEFMDFGSRYGAPTYVGLRVEDGSPFTAPADAVRVVEPADVNRTLPSPDPKENPDMSTDTELAHEPAETAADESQPVFRGTPEDWWNGAEEITESHAAEPNLGDWYIRWLRNSAGTKPSFRVSTPSRPPNEVKRRAMATALKGDPISQNVRRLIKTEEPTPAWMTSEFVMADVSEGGAERGPWHRKPSGKWHLVRDGRVSVLDRAMAKLNPVPATFG